MLYSIDQKVTLGSLWQASPVPGTTRIKR